MAAMLDEETARVERLVRTLVGFGVVYNFLIEF